MPFSAMLPASAAAAGGLFPAKGAAATAALREYRELLRKARSSRSGDESSTSSLFQQAKERVLLRLQEPRRAAPRVDPRRAFGRLQDRWAAARLSLRHLKNEQKERLRQYVATAVGGSSRGVPALSSSSSGSSGSGSGAVAAEPAVGPVAWQQQQLQPAPALVAAAEGVLDARAAQTAMGSNGPLRHLVLASVGGACKLFLAAGARTTVQGQEHMTAALARPPGQGLITVSNHVGSIDDPLITSSLVPASKLFEPAAMRWTMCATDRCFKSAALTPFFRAAKVLPVERGAGMNQFGMQLAQSRLAVGEWVHIFPEGTRSRDGRMQPVRKGVGWLVASAAASGSLAPLVLPFVHSGMERVMPKGSPLPKLGQELKVLVGEPVPVGDLLGEAAAQGWSEQQLHVAIADRVGQALYRLKAQLDGLPLELVAPQAQAAAITISEDTLLPMIQEEMDSLAHRWRDSWQGRWQRLSLPSLTQRMRTSVEARKESLRDRLAASSIASGLVDGITGSGGGGSGRGGSGSYEGGGGGMEAAEGQGGGTVGSWEDGGVAALTWAANDGEAEPRSWQATVGAVASALGGEGGGEGEVGPGLLARQSLLRLLRGGPRMDAPAISSGAGSGVLPVVSLRPEFVAASPLDAVSRAAGAADGSSALPILLAAAADYSAARMQHMRQLLACQPGSSTGTGPSAAAALGALT